MLLRRRGLALKPSQKDALQALFQQNPYPGIATRERLARELGIDESMLLLWLCLFILSGVISPLIFSSILGTYLHGEFLFQYPIILHFHTVLRVLKARILKWFAIPISSGPHFIRTLHQDPSV